MVHEKNRLRRWELSLLLGFALALVGGTWLSGQQAALSDKVVRLHVVGASDSAEDQAVKLRVRDAVLARAEPLLTGVTDAETAQVVLADHLPELARAGAEAAGGAVTAELARGVWFPTRRYVDFALPAGRYDALRLTVGEGKGRNWWCVAFPPLCTAASVEETQTAGGFTDAQRALIAGGDARYEIRFKLLELWEEWTDGGT